MVAKEVAVLAIIFSFISSPNGDSQFMTFVQPDYVGAVNVCIDVSSGCNVSDVISIKIGIGSCGQILDFKTGNVYNFVKDIPNTDYYYKGQLSSCPVHINTIECPKGTFVKSIEWDTEFNLTRGIKIYCNKPESTSLSEAITLSSHPEATFSKTEQIKCAAYKSITFTRNFSMEIDTGLLMEADCTAGDGNSFDKTMECEPLTALSGMTITIETKTNYIKSSSIICSDIPDIAALCEIKNEKRKLSYHSSTTRTATITKKIGVGLTSMFMSESEKNELDFYKKFSPPIEFSLLNNFETHIGKSNETGYDWRNAPKSTWLKERNVTINIVLTPQCETELLEIVGKCSYMEIRPYYFERVDNCNNTTTEKYP